VQLGTVLHLAPHPDDEAIGSPATLMELRDAGWRVVNLACSLGEGTQKGRRENEVREACHRAGFELCIADVLIPALRPVRTSPAARAPPAPTRKSSMR
jgi:LmbE family N-acetylglucosaminyl deacetylase